MLADRDIVCVAGVAWDSYWLSLHQYMSRLAGRTGSSSSTGRWRSRVRSPEGRGESGRPDNCAWKCPTCRRALVRGRSPGRASASLRATGDGRQPGAPQLVRCARCPWPRLREAAPLGARSRRGPSREAARRMGLALLAHRRSSDRASLQSQSHEPGRGDACSRARASPLGRSGTHDRSATPRCEGQLQLEQPLCATRGRYHHFARAAKS